MTPTTRRRLLSNDDALPAAKRQRRQAAAVANTTRPTRDFISTISDEILVRIFSYMDVYLLLDVALVSRRFHAIACDSQLWRPHYYRRFDVHRVYRAPEYKTGCRGSLSTRSGSPGGHASIGGNHSPTWRKPALASCSDHSREKVVRHVDWKKQYRLRHNWARGRCAVEKLHVHDTAEQKQPISPPEWPTLVKVVQGFAITADSIFGLRLWELRTRKSIAQASLELKDDQGLCPSCLAVDDTHSGSGQIDVAIGFDDGTFGVWQFNSRRNSLRLLFRQKKKFDNKLTAIAISYPHLLTATHLGFIALYTFSSPSNGADKASRPADVIPLDDIKQEPDTLQSPYLVTSLKSYYTRTPLALSIRKTAFLVVASIAYTFNTLGGWSIGIQDLDINPSGVVNSRIASSLPTQMGLGRSWPSPDPILTRAGADIYNNPTKLRYSHPYLLVALPDNTLALHICTSTATTLSISTGMRLWGHTSAISDADITPRGKAVSVSARGDEIRLWELQGSLGGCSVEVRPRQQGGGLNVSVEAERVANDTASQTSEKTGAEDGRRNWVGFDEEVVLVLKESSDGQNSLMLYDFT